MKVRLIIVVFLTLLIGMIGSKVYAYNYNSYVENKGNWYCPVHLVVYNPAKEVHKNCKPVVKPAPVVQKRKTLPAVQERQPLYSYGRSRYGSYKAPLIDVDIWVTQDRYRYRGGYGYVRNYYPRYRNRFWFGGSQSRYRYLEYRKYLRYRYSGYRYSRW